ncbi:MAG: D-alanine--D-alanine ligase family protein [Eubacteriales bacterium]|nr:D-alanine--D-alanine ligase family protein [Eubacteriales bacterium]
MRLGLFFGGVSSEYEISLKSVAYVHSCLAELENIEICLIGISRDGKFYHYTGAPEAIPEDRWTEDSVKQIYWNLDPRDPGFFTESFTSYKFHPLDLAFPCVHGAYGEDGSLQGLFEMLDLPYVGAGILGSAICLDKAVARQLFDQLEIPQAKWLWLRKRRYEMDPERQVEHILKNLTLPLFVKPANAGSSVGVCKVKNKKSLIEAIEAAFYYDSKVVIEETIVGRELELAILELGDETRKLVVSPAGEIVSAHEFYDYDAKYANVGSELVIPASLPPQSYNEMLEYAKLAFRSAHCHGLARVDFFYTADGKIYLNEINTMPGFTEISMYPKLMAEAGYPGPALMSALIDNALAGKN